MMPSGECFDALKKRYSVIAEKYGNWVYNKEDRRILLPSGLGIKFIRNMVGDVALVNQYYMH